MNPRAGGLLRSARPIGAVTARQTLRHSKLPCPGRAGCFYQLKSKHKGLKNGSWHPRRLCRGSYQDLQLSFALASCLRQAFLRRFFEVLRCRGMDRYSAGENRPLPERNALVDHRAGGHSCCGNCHSRRGGAGRQRFCQQLSAKFSQGVQFLTQR